MDGETLADWQRNLSLAEILHLDHPRSLSIRILRRRIRGLGIAEAKQLLALLALEEQIMIRQRERTGS